MERVSLLPQSRPTERNCFDLSKKSKTGIAIGGSILAALAIGAGITCTLMGKKIIPVNLSLPNSALLGIGSGIFSIGGISGIIAVVLLLPNRNLTHRAVAVSSLIENVSQHVQEKQTTQPAKDIDNRNGYAPIVNEIFEDLRSSGKRKHWSALATQQAETPAPDGITFEATQNYHEEASAGQLSWCGCQGSQKRFADEKIILNEIIYRYPNKNQPISILSIGSGGLLTDWILLRQLTSLGYTNIKITFADPETSEAHFILFNNLIKNTKFADGVTVQTVLFQRVEDIKGQTFDLAYSHDFKVIELDEENTIQGWETLTAAQDLLTENGFILATHNKDYFFDKKLNDWNYSGHRMFASEFPPAKDNNPFRIYLDDLKDEKFPLLWLIKGLVNQQGYRHIQISLKDYNFFRLKKNQLRIISVLRKLLNLPKDVNIEIVKSLGERDKSDLIVFNTSTREKIATISNLLNEGGQMVCYYTEPSEDPRVAAPPKPYKLITRPSV